MSSPSFDPDASVIPDALWSTVWLSDRDLSAQVPLNYVTRPAVSLSSACFSNNVYDNTAAAICISSLLQSHFERLIVDLYWDETTSQFYFCPASFSYTSGSATTTSSATATSTPSATSATLSSVTVSDDDERHIKTRQVIDPSGVAVENATGATGNTPTSTSSASPLQTTVTSSNVTLYDIGPYQCSKSLDLPWFIQLMQDFVQSTGNTLKANIVFLEFNLHASAPAENPEEPSAQPSTLPSSSLFIGSQFSSTLGAYMFTPDALSSDRSNLNSTWYRVPKTHTPIARYLNLSSNANGILTTTNGWPNLAYVLITKAQRLLLSWGTIDPQMSHYNFTGDSNVFTAKSFEVDVDVQTASDGNITAGCFYDPGEMNPLVVNASWPSSQPRDDGFVTTSSSSLGPLLQFTSNLTDCGISAQINQTVLNYTADAKPLPYLNITQSAIWSWAQNEPSNHSAGDDDNESIYRCALMDVTHDYNGRWRVEHCSQHYRAACRSDSEQYGWQLSEDTTAFIYAADACPQNTTFDVPRTGLESTYLRHYLYSLSNSTINLKADEGDSRSGVWLNFNSLDVEGCWTAAGANASCPYSTDKSTIQNRTVLVPVIAAIVALAITAATLFVKCNSNRRSSKRRKRGDGGWDYEGVPS